MRRCAKGAYRIAAHRAGGQLIEHGRPPPSDADIRAYAFHCDAQDQTADLIATARAVEGMYVEWRRDAEG
ncbi:hypothetical protein GCM10023080_091690 [Streptomyces pseudoechinosporeus]